MAKQVGPASAGGAVTNPGSGATAISAGASATAGTGGAGDEVVPFISQQPGTPVYFPSFHGRAVSWVAVSLIVVAFVAGGLALVFGMTWWLFWAALGVAVVGGLLAMATGIFDDWY